MSRRKSPRSKSMVGKHSVSIAGRNTSVSLENAFWQSLKEIASEHDMTRPNSSLTSTPSGDTPIYRRPFASSCSISIGSKSLSASAPIASDDRQNRIRLRPGVILSFGHRLRTLDVPLAARNRALHYLTNGYKLSADVRRQLIEVVNGYIRPLRRRRGAGLHRMDARAVSGGRTDAAVLTSSTKTHSRNSG
jgi:hypothetical protein